MSVADDLAGPRLARRTAELGYLARELPTEFPAVLSKLCAEGALIRE